MKQDTIPKLMRTPRRVKAWAGTMSGWWYINPNSIDVLAESDPDSSRVTHVEVTHVELTRRQLQRALEIMDSAQDRREP